MKYEILFSEGAVKDLKNVPSKDQIKIIDKIEKLSDNPYPKAVKN
jgi:mRNA-degrading endonuclease RelE of RelBE toxin-antitoxin system